MWDPKTDIKLQKALQDYLIKRNFFLDEDAEYEVIIDGVDIFVSGHLVLCIGLPPVSNYNIHETEFAEYYLSVDKMATV